MSLWILGGLAVAFAGSWAYCRFLGAQQSRPGGQVAQGWPPGRHATSPLFAARSMG